jgi:hypothetical protein
MNLQPYEPALEKTLFRNAQLMQMAARFTGATAAACVAGGAEEDLDEELEGAETDAEEDLGLLAGAFNDPASRLQRDMLVAALAEEQRLVGQLRQKASGYFTGRAHHGKCDDRALRPSWLTMKLWGLSDIPVPAPVFN